MVISQRAVEVGRVMVISQRVVEVGKEWFLTRFGRVLLVLGRRFWPSTKSSYSVLFDVGGRQNS